MLAAGPRDERADGGVVGQRERRRVRSLRTSRSAPCRARALVERHEELRVELRDLLPELVDLALGFGHRTRLAPGRARLSHRVRCRAVPLPRAALEELRAKYLEMLVMRTEHALGCGGPRQRAAEDGRAGRALSGRAARDRRPRRSTRCAGAYRGARRGAGGRGAEPEAVDGARWHASTRSRAERSAPSDGSPGARASTRLRGPPTRPRSSGSRSPRTPAAWADDLARARGAAARPGDRRRLRPARSRAGRQRARCPAPRVRRAAQRAPSLVRSEAVRPPQGRAPSWTTPSCWSSRQRGAAGAAALGSVFVPAGSISGGRSVLRRRRVSRGGTARLRFRWPRAWPTNRGPSTSPRP